ncbi:MAG: GldG family protein [Candidatus Paceibacterota bacterium]|jgi:gliding-associated putative ABC transporter substrate-binding component GldG
MDIKSNKSLKLKTGSVALVLIFFAALNYFVSQNSLYFDLTEDKIYTISDASKNILKNLDKEVKVNFYISKDLPVNMQALKTQLVDTMNQYQDIAGSKLKVAYIEPENTPAKVQDLAQKGIPQLQFNVVEKDKYEVKQGFFGIEIVSGETGSEKREVIPMIQSIDNWEYNFISAVYSVSREKKETVGFLSGHGEKEVDPTELKMSYDAVNVKIEPSGDNKGFYIEKEKTTKDEKGEDKSVTEKVPVQPITLVIVNPGSKITEEEAAILDEYVKNGGNVIVLSGAVNVDVSQGISAELIPDNGLNGFMKKYGIEINNDMIYDASNSNISYQRGPFSMSTPYPFFVKAVSENFGDHTSLSGIQSVIFPWTSSLALADSNDYVASQVISTTQRASAISGSFDVMPDRQFSFDNASKKTIMAVAKPKEADSKSGNIIAVGDPYFILLNFSKQVSDNQTFFLNLIDSVSNTVNLSSIRAKNIADRPVKELSEGEKNYWKFIAILGGALVLDAYGLYRIVRRKKRMGRA